LNDPSALWAYEGLKIHGLDPLEIVSSEMLSCSLHWEHRLGSDGVSIKIRLADGRIINDFNVKGVLNRLSFVHSDHLYLVNGQDQNYAIQELNGLFLSWLNALPCPVLNRPSPYGLAGQWRHESEWFLLASKAGLSTPYYKQTSNPDQSKIIGSYEERISSLSTTSVFVADGHVIGQDMPSNIAKGCQVLAELSKTALLGIEFDAKSTSNWVFISATPSPDLRTGGHTLLGTLAALLKDGSENST